MTYYETNKMAKGAGGNPPYFDDSSATAERQLLFHKVSRLEKDFARLERLAGGAVRANGNGHAANGIAGEEEEAERPPIDRNTLTLAYWMERDTSPPDFMLGELVSTSSRILLVAPTGLGKTNFVMAKGIEIAAGDGFLHWRASEGPRKVLFIDGEMPKRLLKRRLEDAVRRRGGEQPDTFFILCRDDLPNDMPPLNTKAGRRFVERIIEVIGGVDLIIFDNIQALLIGDMKDEAPWQEVMPWVRDLTRRNIGQIWVHHTGHDESHSYGTKTREWQLDTGMLLERIDCPGADIAFRLDFFKSREKTPENRADFEPAIITLGGDQWTSERGGHVPPQHTDCEG
jgi:hypothetical protein